MKFLKIILKPNTAKQGRGKKICSLVPLIFLMLLMTFKNSTYGAETDRQGVLLEVNCAQFNRNLPEDLFGVTSGFFYDANGLALCKQAGFQLMEVLRDMTADPFGPGPLPPPPGFLPPTNPPGKNSRFGMEVSPPRHLPPPPPGLNQRPGPEAFPQGSSFDEKKRRLMASRPRLNTFDEVKHLVEAGLKQKMNVMVAFTILAPPRDGKAFQNQVSLEVKELQRLAAKYDTRIRLFRFGNEPDLADFWRGSPQEFFNTYKLWVQALKGVDSEAIAVAPGFATSLIRPDAEPLGQYLKDFVNYCHRERIPLDMLAIHGYGLDPQFSFGLPTKAAIDYLQKYPHLSPIFGVPRVADNEWNLLCHDPDTNPIFDTAWAAAHNAAALIQLIDNGIQLTVRLGGCSISPPETRLRGDEPDFLLVNKSHKKKLTYYAMAGMNRFIDFPYQVKSQVTNRNFDILAGLSKGKDSLYIAVSNLPRVRLLDVWREIDKNNLKIHPVEERYILQRAAANPESSQYSLNINDIPFASNGGKFRLRRYRIDGTNQGTVVEDKLMAGMKRIKIINSLKGPGIDFILLEAAK
jgi:hypothetical protein